MPTSREVLDYLGRAERARDDIPKARAALKFLFEESDPLTITMMKMENNVRLQIVTSMQVALEARRELIDMGL